MVLEGDNLEGRWQTPVIRYCCRLTKQKSYTRGLGDDATSCKFNTLYCVNDPWTAYKLKWWGLNKATSVLYAWLYRKWSMKTALQGNQATWQIKGKWEQNVSSLNAISATYKM